VIDDEEDPEYKRVVRSLMQQIIVLANASHRGEFTPKLIDDAQELCNSAVRTSRERGVALPDMIVIPFPRQRYINVHRRDAGEKMIQVYLRNTIEEWVAAGIKFEPKDLAEAYSRAYPRKPVDPAPNRRQRRIAEKNR